LQHHGLAAVAADACVRVSLHALTWHACVGLCRFTDVDFNVAAATTAAADVIELLLGLQVTPCQ
jgi:hypothetical protein